MTRRLALRVADPDEPRRAALARWRRRNAPRVPDPDRPHVGDPDGPRLVPCGVRWEDALTDPALLVPGTGTWREEPHMAAHLDFLRRERARLRAEGVDPDEPVPGTPGRGRQAGRTALSGP